MNKVRRITALLTVIVIVVLVIATLVCALTGSPYFFGMLALTFIYYGYLCGLPDYRAISQTSH